MKLFYTRPLIDHAGKPMKAGNDAENKDKEAILGDVIVDALIRDVQGDENVPGNKKMHRWNLGRRVQKGVTEFRKDPIIGSEPPYLDIPSEDISLIKERIAKTYATQVVGPAFNAIESSED